MVEPREAALVGARRWHGALLPAVSVAPQDRARLQRERQAATVEEVDDVHERQRVAQVLRLVDDAAARLEAEQRDGAAVLVPVTGVPAERHEGARVGALPQRPAQQGHVRPQPREDLRHRVAPLAAGETDDVREPGERLEAREPTFEAHVEHGRRGLVRGPLVQAQLELDGGLARVPDPDAERADDVVARLVGQRDALELSVVPVEQLDAGAAERLEDPAGAIRRIVARRGRRLRAEELDERLRPVRQAVRVAQADAAQARAELASRLGAARDEAPRRGRVGGGLGKPSPDRVAHAGVAVAARLEEVGVDAVGKGGRSGDDRLEALAARQDRRLAVVGRGRECGL